MLTLIYILNIITYFTYGYFFFLLLKSFLPMHDSKLIRFFGYLVCNAITGAIIYPNDPVNVAGYFLLFILYMFLFHKGTWYAKLSTVLIFYPIVVSINYLTEDFGRLIWLSGNGEMSLLFEEILHSVTLSLRIPFWLLLWYFCKNLIPLVAGTLTFRMWMILDIICLTSFVGILTIIIYAPENTWITYPACLSNILANFGCIYLSAYIANTIKTDLELENLKYQQSYYNELEQNQQNMRKLRHDMQNHLSVISIFFQNENKEQAEVYFQKLSDEITAATHTFCQNSIVNAVLNSKYNLAMQHEIDCFFNIDLDNLISMDDISLCSLFGNTLDNAIEANLKIPDLSYRSLSVKARCSNKFFSYEISNAKENEIITARKKILTDKANKKSHGFGLLNVKDIVRKYNGTMDISFTDNSFTITILIPLF